MVTGVKVRRARRTKKSRINMNRIRREHLRHVEKNMLFILLLATPTVASASDGMRRCNPKNRILW